jgi:hypothetical protein
MTDPARDVSRTLSSVKAIKEEAKLSRDDGDLEGAVEGLQEGIKMIQTDPDWRRALESGRDPGPAEKQLAWHLADLLGMVGGNLRRLNRLEDALRAFEAGRPYEEDSRWGVYSSYNLVNAVTLPLEAGTKSPSEQTAALQRAVQTLRGQTQGERRMDRWAWADLAQCQLLLRDVAGATESYQRFIELGDLSSVESAVSVLRRLHTALGSRDPETANALEEGIRFLESRGTATGVSS